MVKPATVNPLLVRLGAAPTPLEAARIFQEADTSEALQASHPILDAISEVAQADGDRAFADQARMAGGGSVHTVTIEMACQFLGLVPPAAWERVVASQAWRTGLQRFADAPVVGAALAARLEQDRFETRVRKLQKLGVPNAEAVAKVEKEMGFKLNLDAAAIQARATEIAKLFTKITLPIPPAYHDLPEHQQRALKIIGKAMLLLEAPYRLQMTPYGKVFEKLVMETPALAPLKPYYLRWATVFNMTNSQLESGKAHRYFAFLPGMEQVTRPPGGGMYPPDMTADKFAQLVPKESPFNDEMRVIFEYREDKLIAVPFSEAYAEWLTPAAKLFEQAAELLEHDQPDLANYLRLVAQAYRTNAFTAVDEAWVRLANETLDFNLVPVEQNSDKIRGTVSHFAALLQLRNRSANRELVALNQAFSALEDRLPVPIEYKLPKDKRKPPPISIVESLFAVGDGTNGEYPAVAYNQPNDERVREKMGPRIVLMENLEVAREYTPQSARLADLAINPRYRPLVTERAGKWWVRFHELSHGHGVEYVIGDPTTTSRKALGDIFGTLEELKADLTGIHDAKEGVALGLIPQEILHEIYVTYVVWCLNKLRKGEGEDHARGNLVALNFLQKQGAIIINPTTGVIDFNFEKYGQAVSEASGILIRFKGDGDREGANAFFAQYGTTLPKGIRSVFDAMKDRPLMSFSTTPSKQNSITINHGRTIDKSAFNKG